MKDSYRIDELASRWDVSPRTIYRMIDRQALNVFRIGGVWRIKREEVLKCEEGAKKVDSNGQR